MCSHQTSLFICIHLCCILPAWLSAQLFTGSINDVWFLVQIPQAGISFIKSWKCNNRDCHSLFHCSPYSIVISNLVNYELFYAVHAWNGRVVRTWLQFLWTSFCYVRILVIEAIALLYDDSLITSVHACLKIKEKTNQNCFVQASGS